MTTRIERLQALLPDAHAAALIAAPHHLCYLTAFPSGDSYLLVTRDACYFLTDFRYIEMAKQTVRGADCRQITRLTDTLSTLAEHHGVRTLFLETAYASVGFLARLRSALGAITVYETAELDGWLSRLRAIKVACELE